MINNQQGRGMTMMDDDDKTTTMNDDDIDECSALYISRHRTRPDRTVGLVRSLATATAAAATASALDIFRHRTRPDRTVGR